MKSYPSVREIMWDIFTDENSELYSSNYGGGNIPWQAGCFVTKDMRALDESEMRALIPSYIADDEWLEFLFDSVAECDMIIFKTFQTKE